MTPTCCPSRRSSTLGRLWQLQGMPTTYVIDREGRIYYGAIGERAWDDPAVLDPSLALNR